MKCNVTVITYTRPNKKKHQLIIVVFLKRG